MGSRGVSGIGDMCTDLKSTSTPLLCHFDYKSVDWVRSSFSPSPLRRFTRSSDSIWLQRHDDKINSQHSGAAFLEHAPPPPRSDDKMSNWKLENVHTEGKRERGREWLSPHPMTDSGGLPCTLRVGRVFLPWRMGKPETENVHIAMVWRYSNRGVVSFLLLSANVNSLQGPRRNLLIFHPVISVFCLWLLGPRTRWWWWWLSVAPQRQRRIMWHGKVISRTFIIIANDTIPSSSRRELNSGLLCSREGNIKLTLPYLEGEREREENLVLV